MSILINGMKMPQSCSNCNWSRYSFPNAWCSMTHHKVDIEVAKNGRPDDCPLIEVPEPHGRLIDANAMFKDICDSINEMTAIGVAVDGQWLWDKLNDALKNAPTIIPASEED